MYPRYSWLDRWIILSLLRDLRVDSGSSSYIQSYSVSYEIRLFHLFEPRTERMIEDNEIHSLKLKLLIATQKRLKYFVINKWIDLRDE